MRRSPYKTPKHPLFKNNLFIVHLLTKIYLIVWPFEIAWRKKKSGEFYTHTYTQVRCLSVGVCWRHQTLTTYNQSDRNNNRLGRETVTVIISVSSATRGTTNQQAPRGKPARNAERGRHVSTSTSRYLPAGGSSSKCQTVVCKLCSACSRHLGRPAIRTDKFQPPGAMASSLPAPWELKASSFVSHLGVRCTVHIYPTAWRWMV